MKKIENKKPAPVKKPKKGDTKWNINIRVAENGYIVSVYPLSNKVPYQELSFIATTEKELSSILAKYK